MERVFDCVPQWDRRNRDFPITELVSHHRLQQKIWDLPEHLDQGNEGACVGFGWTHELLAEPTRITDVDPRTVYKRAQQIDEWPGEEYSGTSVLAGAKAIQELGHLTEYRWAFTVDDVLATLSGYGPVVVGLNWHEGMRNTDGDGYIRATGPVQGRHCVCLRGVLQVETGFAVLGRNSWGYGWGVEGDFKMTADDLKLLLASGGDVCVPVTR